MQYQDATLAPRGWRFASMAICGFAVTMFTAAAVATDREELERICVITGGKIAATMTIISACTELIDSDPEDDPAVHSRNNVVKATHFYDRGFAYVMISAVQTSDFVSNFKKASADFDSVLKILPPRPDMGKEEVDFVEMAKGMKISTGRIADCFSSNIASCTAFLDDKLAPEDPVSVEIFRTDAFKNLVYQARGLIYFNRKEYSNAIADYSRSIEIFPKDADAFGVRGAAYVEQGQYGKGIADLNHAIGFNGKNDNGKNEFYLELRGVAYIKQGQYRRAMSDYDAALRINPKNNEVIDLRRDLEQYLAQVSDRKGAIADRNRECAFRCGLTRGNCQNSNDLATAGGFMMGGFNLGGLALGSMFHQNCGSQASCMQSCLSR
jgi:tetratricopeptide (TPR) repeat protein